MKVSKSKCKTLHFEIEKTDTPGWAGGLTGKQLGIKGCWGPGGQVEYEPAIHPCQEGHCMLGVRIEAASRPREMFIPL